MEPFYAVYAHSTVGGGKFAATDSRLTRIEMILIPIDTPFVKFKIPVVNLFPAWKTYGRMASQDFVQPGGSGFLSSNAYKIG